MPITGQRLTVSQRTAHSLAKAAFFPAPIIFPFLAQQMRRGMGIHLLRLEIHPKPDGAQPTQAAPLPAPMRHPVVLAEMTGHQAALLTARDRKQEFTHPTGTGGSDNPRIKWRVLRTYWETYRAANQPQRAGATQLSDPLPHRCSAKAVCFAATTKTLWEYGPHFA
jgi:hypothetical protein